MKKRGKILRDPRSGPGLLMIEGRQYWFRLEGVWKTELPPTPGLDVEVKLDRAGQIVVITTTAESPRAESQSQRSRDAAQGAGMRVLSKIAAKCGLPNLLRR